MLEIKFVPIIFVQTRPTSLMMIDRFLLELF
jgi:hypothetical protein